MKLYCYDSTYKCFTKTEDAAIDIAATEATGKECYFISAHSTEVAIPVYGTHEIPQFDEVSKSWKIIKDYRNVAVVDKNTCHAYYYQSLGELPSNITDILPSDITQLPFLKWDEVSSTWVENLDALRASVKLQRDYLLSASDAKILRYNSELLLVSKGMISKTTNTEEEMLLWESYRQQLREFFTNWEKGRVLPTAPDIA